MKKILVVEIVSYLLILLFLYTGLSKFIDFKDTVFDLAQAPVVGRFPKLAAILIPSSELIVAVLLFMPKTRRIGLLCSFIMMTVFTLYVAYMLTFLTGLERPCSCGGIMRKMTWRLHLIFNTAFTALSFTAFLWHKKTNSDNFFEGDSVNIAELR